MAFFVFIGFLLFILILHNKQKKYVQQSFELKQALNTFRKNYDIFMNLSPPQQQSFLNQLTDRNRTLFLQMIEKDKIFLCHYKEIELMNLFSLWAQSQNMISVSFINIPLHKQYN